jgi:hypothetical protein
MNRREEDVYALLLFLSIHFEQGKQFSFVYSSWTVAVMIATSGNIIQVRKQQAEQPSTWPDLDVCTPLRPTQNLFTLPIQTVAQKLKLA